MDGRCLESTALQLHRDLARCGIRIVDDETQRRAVRAQQLAHARIGLVDDGATGEDGALQPLAREAGGLLVLVPHDDAMGVLLPGGRLVVDFPTNFANAMSMRRVTRQSFELLSDGSGVLRLVEPAWAERVGEKWQLVSPGKLAGLKSD